MQVSSEKFIFFLLLSIIGESVKFVYICESIAGHPKNIDTEVINEALKKLQEKYAKIIDVKLSTCSDETGTVIGTYLIFYEVPAEEPLM